MLVFGTLFAIGDFVLAEPLRRDGFAILALVCGALIARNLNTPALRTAAATALALMLARRCRCTARRDDDKVLTNVEGRGLLRTRRHAALDLVPKVKQLLTDRTSRSRKPRPQAQVTLPDSSLVTLGALDARAARVLQPDRHRQREVRRLSRQNALRGCASARRAGQLHLPDADDADRRARDRGRHRGRRDNLTLNVYNSSPPDGVAVTYTAGDKLGTTVHGAGRAVAGARTSSTASFKSQVNKLTQAAMDEFSELGVPTSVQGAKNTVIKKAKSALHLPF